MTPAEALFAAEQLKLRHAITTSREWRQREAAAAAEPALRRPAWRRAVDWLAAALGIGGRG